MPTLTAEMKRTVVEQKFGYVASVCADGSPNVSPKGTFLVLDDDHVMFGEMRSPQTAANIAENPTVEINFVDVFARKGFRCKGPARYVERGSAEFERLLPGFVAQWGELCDLFNGIVVVRAEQAKPLVSPAYDIGAEEAALRRQWLTYFSELQEQHLSEL